MRRAGVLFLASEVKALAEMSGQKLKENPDHISRFLVNGYRSLYKKKATFFKDVEEFPRASVGEITDRGEIRAKRYWTLNFKPTTISRKEAVYLIREALIKSLEIRLRSDVPIAFCLSGGIDSTVLAGLADGGALRA